MGERTFCVGVCARVRVIQKGQNGVGCCWSRVQSLLSIDRRYPRLVDGHGDDRRSCALNARCAVCHVSKPANKQRTESKCQRRDDGHKTARQSTRHSSPVRKPCAFHRLPSRLLDGRAPSSRLHLSWQRSDADRRSHTLHDAKLLAAPYFLVFQPSAIRPWAPCALRSCKTARHLHGALCGGSWSATRKQRRPLHLTGGHVVAIPLPSRHVFNGAASEAGAVLEFVAVCGGGPGDCSLQRCLQHHAKREGASRGMCAPMLRSEETAAVPTCTESPSLTPHNLLWWAHRARRASPRTFKSFVRSAELLGKSRHLCCSLATLSTHPSCRRCSKERRCRPCST